MNKLANFDWKDYLSLNPDLEKGGIINKIDAFYHYVSHGINENRKCKFDIPEDFDHDKYLELNPDLLDAGIKTKQDAKIHWVKFGRSEKRKYKEDIINISSNINQFVTKLESEIDEDNIKDTMTYHKQVDPKLLFEKFNSFAILLHIGDGNKDKVLFYADLIKFNKSLIRKYGGTVKLFIYLSDYIADKKDEFQEYFDEELIITPNIAMDLHSFLTTILDKSFDYDMLIKYHTKTIPQWSLDNVKCFSSEVNFLLTLSKFYYHSSISIIGDIKWIVPAFYGISQDYFIKIKEFLKELNVNVEEYNIVKKQNENIDLNKINYKKYLDLHDDFHEQELYSQNKLKSHAKWIKNNNIKEFRIGLCQDFINDKKIIKYIAGTMFAFRGSVINEIREKFGTKLKSYFSKLETGLVKDADGTMFTYTHTFERLQGILSSHLGYYVYGLDYDSNSMNTFQDTSLAFNNYSIKKKICFVSHDLTKTGAPKILLDVIKHFTTIYDCYLIARNKGKLEDEVIKVLGKDKVFVLMKDDVTSFGIPNFLLCIEETQKIFNLIRPDVCYINSLASSFAIFSSYASGIPNIFHGHEALMEIINLHKTNQSICYDLGEMIDYCICTDNKLKHYLENLYKVEHPEVLYNFTNLRYQEDINKLDFLDTNHTQYQKIIGMAGTICYRKGFDIFIEVAKRCPQFQFIWAGVGNYNKVLIPQNMLVKSFCSEEMIRFYRSIDIFVLTSRSDACPLVLVEALYNKCPVMLFERNVQVYDVIRECGGKVINEFVNVKSIITEINQDMEFNINFKLIQRIFSKTNFMNKIKSLIINALEQTKTKHELKILEYQNKYRLNFYTKILNNYRSYFHHVNGSIKLIPSNHRVAEEYLIANADLRLIGFSNFKESYNHFYSKGRVERRSIYRPHVLCMKRIVFVIHSSELTGAPIVGAELANYLQEYFDVIILSNNIGPLLKNYVWKNPPIELMRREFEFGVTRYLDRLELAIKLLKNLSPDLVYVNSSCSEVYAQASSKLNIPIIYHGHEGEMGMDSELKAYIIPFKNCHKEIKNIKYYSASLDTSKMMRKYLGICKTKEIKEFQAINKDKILRKANEKISIELKKEDRLLFGMVGSGSYRKGVDLFVNCARTHPEHDFVWIGKKNDLGHLFDELPNNMKFLGLQKNPQKFMKHFDFFLLSSREDLFPLVVIESLILDTQVIYYKQNIGAKNELDKLGCIGIETKQDNNLSEAIKSGIINKEKKINKGYLEKFYVKTVVDQIIVSNIIDLTKNIINDTLHKLYWNNRYGWITYNNKEINRIILELYREKTEFNEEIYKRKYLDISQFNINCKKHYNTIGLKMGRNCLHFDWKLVVANKPELLNLGVFDERSLFEYVCNNDLDIKKLSHVEFDQKKYLERYPDLQKLKLTDKEIINHWINYGAPEGRCCIAI